MATISVANFKTLADSIAKQAEILKAAVGTDGSDTGACAEGAQNNIDRIVGFTDADQIAALLTPAQAALSRIASTNALKRLLPELLRALDNHVGGINEWGEANDVRVHYLLGEVVSWLNPARLFPPVVDPIATFEVTGAGAGTYTHVEDIDTGQYGKANLVLETTASIGVGSLVATITCVKLDGTTEDKEVAVTDSSASGAQFDVGTHDTDMYVGVSGISVSGGVAGDAFKIVSEIERAIAL
jgi:hypothetical protein